VQIRVCFARAALVAPASLLVMVLAASATAGARLYTGSLVIDAFGNDTTTGASPPFTTSTRIGIPLTGRCHTVPYHPKETLEFPTTPHGTQVFTIPAYGGAMITVDTNGDTIPDVPSGCGDASREAGAPLNGVGPVNTTGAATTSRTPNDRRRKQPDGQAQSLTTRLVPFPWACHSSSRSTTGSPKVSTRST